MLCGVVGFQAFTLLLMFFQCNAIDRVDLADDEEEAASTSLLSAPRGGERRREGGSKSDRFAALEDEGLTTAAASKYQAKNSSYYDKYGIRRA